MDCDIKSISSREILSSNSTPTIETKIVLENGVFASASVPYGSSSGKYEAVTLVDNDQRYDGKGMLKAIENVVNIIAPKLIGLDCLNQKNIDQILLSLDSTPRKEILGGNSLLSVSLACARTASVYKNIPLYEHICDIYSLDKNITKLPKPMMVLMEGGKHADNSTDFQEYLIAVTSEKNTCECVRIGAEVYKKLGDILSEKGFDINVGMEGAYAATKVKSNKEPLIYLKDAIEKAGYTYNDDVSIALDTASSEFYETGKYNLELENKTLNSSELLEYYKNLASEMDVFSIEDGFSEDDWEGWQKMFSAMSGNLKIVGDDLVVTQKERLKKAIEKKTINSMIIKPNQVGTLTETIETVFLAKENNISLIVSHRGGGETTDTFIVDLAVAIGADFLKVGPSRGERTVKYNRLTEIGQILNL